MVKFRLSFWVTGVVFFLSLFLFTFSIFQIWNDKMEVQRALEEWEKPEEVDTNQDQLVLEDLVLVENSISTEYQGKEEFINTTNEKDIQDTHPTSIQVPKVEQSPPPLYKNRPDQGEIIGKLTIPKLNKNLPIIHGTGQKELKKGVGHYIGSVLPGESDNSVLAGHRDGVFRGLGVLAIGDRLEVETSAGIFIYEIAEQKIVESNDRTVIVSHKSPILTLVTCYPFDFIGSAPQRYILTAKLQ
jgi:sortase A